jgi:hypothetical protein
MFGEARLPCAGFFVFLQLPACFRSARGKEMAPRSSINLSCLALIFTLWFGTIAFLVGLVATTARAAENSVSLESLLKEMRE